MIIAKSWFGTYIAYVGSGDYVLRDPAGGPRGMVRVMLKWKYPFQPPVDGFKERWGMETGEVDEMIKSNKKEEERKAEASQRPTAKPRAKVMPFLSLGSKHLQMLL